MKSRLLRGLLAFGVGTLLCLAAGEAALRIREYLRFARLPETWATYDPDLGYKLNAGYGDINAQGMRSRPVGEKGARQRLLLLGDSVGYYGDTLDDTWPGRLELALRGEAGSGPEVLNASIKGYTNYQEIAWLEKFGLALKPDLVGIGFVFNDCHKFLHGFRIQSGRIIGQTYDLTEEALATVGEQRGPSSYLWEWLRGRFKLAAAAAEQERSDGFAFDFMPDFNTAWKDRPWGAIEQQMTHLLELAQRHGFRPFVVAFPFGLQYRADYLARDRAHVLKPQRLLTELCQRLRIPLLDLYADLTPAADLEADGIHLTPAGRGHVAARVAAFLRQQDLVRH